MEFQKIEEELKKVIEVNENKQKGRQDQLIKLERELVLEKEKAREIKQLEKEIETELTQKNELIEQLEAKL